ncbi:MAG: hypothetical protein IH965_13205, partial [Gemmatimonadetes bacterium]|nr:hypothetical protein [Gemmatimonadota bacterium]
MIPWRRRLVLAAIFWGVAPPCLPAQGGWDATLIIDPFPSPYLSDWQTNPTFASLTIVNLTGRQARATIHFTVVDPNGAVLLSGRSDPQLIPDREPTVFNTASTIGGTTDYASDLEDLVVRTGRLPEGDYTACVLLTDESGFVIADNICADFSTIYPDPPYLIFPMDGDTVANEYPIFDWMPSQVPVDFQVGYVVQIAEVLAGQPPRQALTANVLHYEDPELLATSFQYPLGALPLESGKRYAWWVQALDQNGVPIAANEGRSEIWTFIYSDRAGSDGGDDEIFGDVTATRFVHVERASGPLAGLATASFDDVKDRLAEIEEGDELSLPLPFPDLNLFDDIPVSDVRIALDDGLRSLAISGTAVLLGQSVDLLFLGYWGTQATATFAFGIKPVDFRIDDLVSGADGSSLSEFDLSEAGLMLVSGPLELDTKRFPTLAEDFYSGTEVSLRPGVNLRREIDLAGTTLGRALQAIGIQADQVILEGRLGVGPNALFDNGGAREAPGLDLRATLTATDIAGFPDWLTPRQHSVRFTAAGQSIAVSLETVAEGALGGGNQTFVLSADIGGDSSGVALAFEGRMEGAWDAPFGLDWLTVDSVRLRLAAGVDSAGIGGSASLSGAMRLGDGRARLAIGLMGEGGALTAKFTAAAMGLTTADVASFINNGFSTSLPVPSNPLVLDSIALSFGVGSEAGFDLAASITQSLTVDDGFALIGTMLPGSFTPPEFGIDVSALGNAWFDIHWVPDSTWGGLGGSVTLAAEGRDPFAGSASLRYGQTGEDTWFSAEFDLGADDTDVPELLSFTATQLGGTWQFPSSTGSLGSITLDSARLQLGLDTRSDSAWAVVSGRGSLTNGQSSVAATASFAFRDVGENTWARGQVNVEVGSLTLPGVLQMAVDLLPGNWSLPDGLDSLNALTLDTATLGLGFAIVPEQGADSIWAHVSGTGRLDLIQEDGQVVAGAEFAFTQVGQDTWVLGEVHADVGAVTIPEALAGVTRLLPGTWTMPDGLDSLQALQLDTASLLLGFATSPQGLDSLWARLSGDGSLDLIQDGSQFTAGATFAFTRRGTDTWVLGELHADVGAVTIPEALAGVTRLLPGTWTMPDGLDSLQALQL